MLERVLSNSSLLDLGNKVETPPLETKTTIQPEKPKPRRRRIINSFSFNQTSLQKTCPYNPAASSVTNSLATYSTPSKDGKVCVRRQKDSQNSGKGEHYFLIYYRIFRSVSLSSADTIPIVVIHGGPGIPSNYMYPLANVVTSRPIVFFDQLGCGQSDAPTDKSL